MSDVTRVGRRVGSYSYSPSYQAYTKVVLTKDNETSYTAGNSTGRTLEVSCPFATQSMANAILAQIQGYEYQPFAASDALLDPSAELGDGIYADGDYAVLGKIDTQFDALCASDIAAPDGGEMASEYPYLPQIVRRVNTAQAQAQAAQSAANQAALDAASAQSDANDANAIITGWQFAGSSVKINGANIEAGTIKASKLQGGTVSLLNASGTTAGTMEITGATTANFAVRLTSNGALGIKAANGSVSIQSDSSTALELTNYGVIGVGGDLRSSSNGVDKLGTSAYRWAEIWCTQSSINSTSDRNKKHDITYDLSDYDEFFDAIKPCTYKFNDGTSGRTHIGMISQDIEENLTDQGMTGTDFAGFMKDEVEDEEGHMETLYGLRYSEFIGLMIDQIQKLKARVKELEERNG